jgi:hypothetical protein
MASIPLVALSSQTQQPSPLDQYSKLISLKNAMQQQQFQQQNQPLELQERQQAVQSGSVDLQMKQNLLKNTQVAQGALTDPNFQKDYADFKKSKEVPLNPGITPAATPAGAVPDTSSPMQLHPLAQFLAEKKGLPLLGPGGAMEISNSLTTQAQKMAELAKTQGEAGKAHLDTYTKQLDNFDNLAEPILGEKDPAKQQAALTGLKSELQQHPDLYPQGFTQNLGKINSVQDLQAAANSSHVHAALVEDATKQTDLQQKQLMAGAPTPQQQQTAASTVASYGAVPQNMRAAFTNEIKNAPSYEILQGVQKRADAANESFQRSADARAQASAMKDVATSNLVAGKLAGEDEKLGSALDQTKGIRDLLDLSKGGNQTATPAAQVRFAEHQIVEGGVKRMNQVELNALTQGLGTYGRQFQAWVDKGFQGKMPEGTNAEMKSILDAEDKSANTTHDRTIGYITNRYIGKDKGTAAAPGAAKPHPFFSQFGGQAQ